MALKYANLDPDTRRYMLEELDRDLAVRTLYISPRLTDEGAEAYPELLHQAIENHDDAWLAEELRSHDYLHRVEERWKDGAELIPARVPHTAAETLAESEFNRYYIRGLCARALAEGITEVEVYRGKEVQQPRPASQAKIGKHFPARVLLGDLRRAHGVESVLGVPAGPNSGLTIRLPQAA